MELQVENSGDRQFKAWVGAWPSDATLAVPVEAHEIIDVPPHGSGAVTGFVGQRVEAGDEVPSLLDWRAIVVVLERFRV
jgi:hypothetical protein